MEECGMPSGSPTTFKTERNVQVASMPTTWSTITGGYVLTGAPDPTTDYPDSYVFQTADGIAVNLFYNPYCVSDFWERSMDDEYHQHSLDVACMSGVYDMNGLQKPNQVGKDIGFFGVFYNGVRSTVAATLPHGSDTGTSTWAEANEYCKAIKGYRLPSIDELSTLYLGHKITGRSTPALWSSTGRIGLTSMRILLYNTRGHRGWFGVGGSLSVECVRE